MFINTKVYDALIGAHMREIAAMEQTIKAKDNREELRTDNRDDDNHYHKMPEE